MAHKCTAAIVHCIDFRIQAAINQWLEDRGIMGDTDRISIAGASKASNHDVVMQNLKISAQLHEVDTIILTQHRDCGAYGGDETELINDLHSLVSKVQAEIPEVKVVPLIIEPVWAIREIQL